MALKLSNLTRESVTSIWNFQGEQIKLTYSPSRWTGETEDRISEIEERGRPVEAMVEVILSMVTEWEGIEDDDGKPAELTRENLNKVPAVFLGEMLTFLRTANRPASEEGKASGGTSRRKGSLESGPTGTGS